MGTAILTNLNGMTNPPSDLNEITTGWKFFMATMNSISESLYMNDTPSKHKLTGTISLAAGTILTLSESGINNYQGYDSGSVQVATWPTKISALAIMHANTEYNRNQNTHPWKTWPSNPTTANILDETGYPLHVYFNIAHTPVRILHLSAHITRHDSDNDLEYGGQLNSFIELTSTGAILKVGVRANTSTYSSGSGTISISSPTIQLYGWYLPA